ncbi:MAG: hypothetical protein R3358_05355, partial [Woeseiaceae bacterium]|nr:hypothetical protein [Woeseiaceae bacterium]
MQQRAKRRQQPAFAELVALNREFSEKSSWHRRRDSAVLTPGVAARRTPDRIVVRTSICLLAGAMALQLISFPPGSDLFVVLLVALILWWPWLRRRDLLLLLAGGALFWQASAVISDSRLDARFEGDSLLTTIRIEDFPKVQGEVASFIAVTL